MSDMKVATDINNTSNPNYLNITIITDPNKLYSPTNNENNEKFYTKNTILLISLVTILIASIILNIILLIKTNKKTNCGSGFFRPNDDNSNCYKCQMSNCQTCRVPKIIKNVFLVLIISKKNMETAILL